MQKTTQNHDDLAVAVVCMLAVLISSLLYIDSAPSARNPTLLQTESFSPERAPTNIPATPGDLVNTRVYSSLNRSERRLIYNAIMFFCNEEKDDKECHRFMSYCGESCQILTKNKDRLSGNF